MTIEQKLFHTLNDLGISRGTLARQYLEDCILVCVENGGRYTSFTKDLYLTVGDMNGGVAAQTVSSSIRNTMRDMLQRGNPELMQKVFGRILEQKSYFSASVFISTIAKYIMIYD